MAEILGAVASGVTVAGLLKLCLEAFEIIQVARKQTFEFDKLCLRLNIERARLYTWGQTMEIFGNDPQKTTNRLKEFRFEVLVIDALQMILSLFENSDRLRKRYGCSSKAIQTERRKQVIETTFSTTAVTSVAAFAESFDNFGIQNNQPGQVARLANKARWIIEDRNKFFDLILEIRSLIDGLQDITKSISTVARQEGVLRYGVQQIRDPESLNLLTEVCQTDYPDISDAASTKLDVMSLSTHKLENIEVWMNSTGDQSVGLENDLESMSITELQQLVRTLMAQDSKDSILSGNTLYSDTLQQRDQKIMEQEALIQRLTAAAARQDQLISELRNQYRDRHENVQSSILHPIETRSPDQLTPEASLYRMSTSTLAAANTTMPKIRKVEGYTVFGVTLDDPTRKVLPATLRQYNIGEDWWRYALYITYGDQEHRCGPDESPLLLFKNLDKKGLKPRFVLRKMPPGEDLNSAMASTVTTAEPDVDNDTVDGGWI